MSALNFARQALGREKPHSSITDLVEILTASHIAEEAYDGYGHSFLDLTATDLINSIPDLVEVINLQAAGPAEASRALRKKLKHGNSHQQYRALVLLKALVENCGKKFTSATFATDGHLTDALKNMSADSNVDQRVRKKLMLVLASWRDQFQSDPSMAPIAGLYKQCSRETRRRSNQEVMSVVNYPAEDTKRIEKEDAKARARKEKEQVKARKLEEERQRRLRQNQERRTPPRAPFVFEKEKPKVLASIADASQASSNLSNAITLVNLEKDSLQENRRVTECLERAREARKSIVRYIQLVENEEVIGTLIETNDRIMAAIETYDKLLAEQSVKDHISGVTDGIAATHIDDRGVSRQYSTESGKQTRKSQDIFQERDSHLHPDLHDLSFGPLGESSTNLPPPLRPSTLSDDGKEDNYDVRGSLSDFSDYSSDEETRGGASTHKRGQDRNYIDVSDDEPYARSHASQAPKDEDPFADPFADHAAVEPSKGW
ncbi:hypothetical protein H0H81_007461 [Sphagnurus paluster]|uniref:VHS domain-containing protein n=1 Tax=Sphagnurus paluster TaxID=117069 RepID=A0A9P7KNC1_9AGAR|nr:hypothetical protein H0H81_007461 [Sphagnurus paluster]